MMFKSLLISALAATALAMPTESHLEVRTDSVNPNDFCPSGLLFGSFQCCITRVLDGVASLDCEAPKKIPKDCVTPDAICKASNQGKPQCCTLPILGLGLVCQDV
ncbi:fungal hydrophobin-domain-containing protein [Aspergillus karnatakaensis]|uniref:fungal hydrophobin-domain-containing protein n=1 Tax=Aspergillus karnatakaensis TaxID=1810916 RepID=UPI003CCE07B7